MGDFNDRCAVDKTLTTGKASVLRCSVAPARLIDGTRGNKCVAIFLVVLCGCLCLSSARAKELEFDFKDPKGVNSIFFELDSVLEPIMGLATGISGKVRLDPADPMRLKGRIVVDAASVRCSLPLMSEVLRSADWMDVKSYPTIEFVVKKVKDAISTRKNVTRMTIVGDFTCRGVTRQIVVPVEVTYLPGRLGDRLRGKKGDLLVLRSTFSIKRADFGIKPEMGPESVAEEIQLRVRIVGAAVRK